MLVQALTLLSEVDQALWTGHVITEKYQVILESAFDKLCPWSVKMYCHLDQMLFAVRNLVSYDSESDLQQFLRPKVCSQEDLS